MSLKNQSLLKQAENGTKGMDGAPNILNKLVDLSRMFSLMNTESLYFPGQTADDKLAVELGQVSGLLSVSYNTKLPTEQDYDAHITELSKLKNTVSKLNKQLQNSIDKLNQDKQDLMLEQQRKLLNRTSLSSSFSSLEQHQSKKRKAEFMTNLAAEHPHKKFRKAVTPTTTATTTLTTIPTTTTTTPIPTPTPTPIAPTPQN